LQILIFGRKKNVFILTKLCSSFLFVSSKRCTVINESLLEIWKYFEIVVLPMVSLPKKNKIKNCYFDKLVDPAQKSHPKIQN
jgi:hypothetical protein